MQILKAATRSSPWFYAFALISLFLCFVTVFARILPQPFTVFNLRNESNLAALFSGLFLLIIALHAFDGRSIYRVSRPQVASAWMMLSLVLVALSFDEIGSLHERVGELSGLGHWLAVLPFGLIFAAMSGYAVMVLYRTPGQRITAILICIGFLLFASVALQEYIEHRVDWSANRYLRFFKGWFRPVLEEGTELLAMLVLLRATMNNTRGILSDGEPDRFPVLEGVVSWRPVVLIMGLIGAPLIAYITVILPPDPSGPGMPADWPAAALYALAALAAARPYFVSRRGVGWTGWGLVMIAVVGCASTILPPESGAALPLITILGAAAFAIWILDSRYASIVYVPAGIFLLISHAGAWLAPDNDIVFYATAQYVALAMYWVNTSLDQH